MKAKIMVVAGLAAILLAASGAMADDFGTGANRFTVDFVTISGDASSVNGMNISQYSFGSPAYKTFLDPGNDYRMGVYEITNDQWDKFKAELGVPVTGDPSMAYGEDPYWTGTHVPTNRVSWHEAAQFVNWLNTSKGHPVAYKFTGTQGQGDYALDTWSPAEGEGADLFRHKDAFYYLPTENEWVKAAYWNGTTLQTYANASPGDLVFGSPDPAKWNYRPSARGEPWSVGSGSEELNGTFDMMGNLWEWTEDPFSDPRSSRDLRGGSYHENDTYLVSSHRYYSDVRNEGSLTGFRVASDIPEPCSLVLLSLGGLALIRRRRR
jgi:formylglycine-generating enzyme required for sulfatase activity